MDQQAASTIHIRNDRVTVTEWSLAPGTATGLHRHGRDYVVVPLTSGTLELRTPDGDVHHARLTAGEPYFRKAGVEHDVANRGHDTIVFTEIEIE